MAYLRMLRGLTAIVAIVVLGVLAMLLNGIPFLRKVLWAAVALVAVAAGWNEITSGG